MGHTPRVRGQMEGVCADGCPDEVCENRESRRAYLLRGVVGVRRLTGGHDVTAESVFSISDRMRFCNVLVLCIVSVHESILGESPLLRIVSGALPRSLRSGGRGGQGHIRELDD